MTGVQTCALPIFENSAKELGSAILLITHDLGVVAGMTDRVCVMYGGQIVETGNVDDIYYQPRMPYTWGLLDSIPRLNDDAHRRLQPIPGSPPNMSRPPAGCRFSPRCGYVQEQCLTAVPDLVAVHGAGDGHLSRCVRVEEPAFAERFAPADAVPS